MKKRNLSQTSVAGGEDGDQYKKARNGAKTVYNRIATKEDAAAVDNDLPLEKLLKAVEVNGQFHR